MINALLSGFLTFLTQIITILLTPINNLLTTYVPSTATAFSYVNQFFGYLSSYTPFVLSYFGFTSEILAIFIILITANVMIPFVMYTTKLIIKWWDMLT